MAKRRKNSDESYHDPEDLYKDEGLILFQPVEKVRQDILEAIRGGSLKLEKEQIRYFVDLYYQLQDFRKAAFSQESSSSKNKEPTNLVEWAARQMKVLEVQVKLAMDAWTDTDPTSKWAKSVYGIGPVLSAGLAAHIDIKKAPTVGAIWRFGGYDPTLVWEPKTKRPWNADLKVLFWKIGDSFKKFHKRPKCVYGKLYLKRKVFEIARNENGGNAECAAETLKARKIKDKETRECYESGKLPKGRIDLRAMRWATKIFLAHWHDKEFRSHYGTPPPKPYPIAILDHAHEITPDNIQEYVASESADTSD